MKEKDLKRIEQEGIVVPLVDMPTVRKDVEIRPRFNGQLSDSQIRMRCRKLANEILSRETKEVKHLG
jgi:protein involved in sex pheromone biosynthesis